MGGEGGILSPIMDPLFGKAPKIEAPVMPSGVVPEINDNAEAEAYAAEQVKKRRLASAKSGRQSTMLTDADGVTDQAELGKKTLLGE